MKFNISPLLLVLFIVALHSCCPLFLFQVLVSLLFVSYQCCRYSCAWSPHCRYCVVASCCYFLSMQTGLAFRPSLYLMIYYRIKPIFHGVFRERKYALWRMINDLLGMAVWRPSSQSLILRHARSASEKRCGQWALLKPQVCRSDYQCVRIKHYPLNKYCLSASEPNT